MAQKVKTFLEGEAAKDTLLGIGVAIPGIIDQGMQELKVTNREDIKILDIGAGTGRYSVSLCEEGYDVTAVEAGEA